MIDVPKVKPIETSQVPEDVQLAQHRLVLFAIQNGAFTLHFQMNGMKAEDFPIGDWEIFVKRVA